MKTCVPRAAQRMLPKSVHRESRTGQREELMPDVVSTDALANLGKLG